MQFEARDRRLEGDTILRQTQLTQIYLLDVFVEICRKHNLTYFLDGGTALGAARHQAFIPWDDDIDVGMPIRDYETFLRVAPKELPENLILTPGPEDANFYPNAKLRDRSSFYCEKETVISAPCGIFIDIFPFVKIPKLPRRFGFGLTELCGTAWLSARSHRILPHRTVFGIFVSGIKATVWMLIYHVTRVVFYILRPFYPTVWRNRPDYRIRYKHDGFAPEMLFPTQPVRFEGREYAAPRDLDGYLTRLYGNWRALPPPDQREWHASIICPTKAPDAPWARDYRESAFS